MSLSRVIAIVACASSLLAACSGKKKVVYKIDPLVQSLYASALVDNQGKISGDKTDTQVVRSVTVYRTSFQQKFVESGGVMAISSVNENQHDTVNYYPPPTGNKQELYLVNVKARGYSDTWFYYSLSFRVQNGQQVPFAFGKAYCGTDNRKKRIIYFSSNLVANKEDYGFRFSRSGKQNMFFVLDELQDSVLRVNRVVMQERNKFGGPNPYIFKVAQHFPAEMKTIDFHRIGTYNF